MVLCALVKLKYRGSLKEKMQLLQPKETAIDEIHYLKPNQTIRLAHSSIVIGSFISNKPVTINYKEGKITSMHPGYYTLDEDGKFEITVSYLYYLD